MIYIKKKRHSKLATEAKRRLVASLRASFDGQDKIQMSLGFGLPREGIAQHCPLVLPREAMCNVQSKIHLKFV